jgi:hypothetical protein
MKLSEAILLGNTMLTPKAGALHFPGQNAGCALGMAAVARGCSFVRRRGRVRMEDRRAPGIENIFGSWLLLMVARPCDCPGFIKLNGLHFKEVAAYFFASGPALPQNMRIKDIIAHVFDDHIMKREDWTLQQLVAWIERWEPSELTQTPLRARSARRLHTRLAEPFDLAVQAWVAQSRTGLA